METSSIRSEKSSIFFSLIAMISSPDKSPASFATEVVTFSLIKILFE